MRNHANKSQENQVRAVANQPSRRKEGSKATFVLVDNRPEAIQLRKLQEMADNSPQAKEAARLQAMMDSSPQMVAQRQQLERRIGQPVQRQIGLEDDDLQMKADPTPVQRQIGLEDDDLQMKADPAPAQRQDMEDDDLQMKVETAPVQRQGMEDDDLQMKAETAPVQRQNMEDDDLQMKAETAPAQRQDMEDEEEPVQSKAVTNQVPAQPQEALARPENHTGLPDSLKAGVENLSGVSLNDVRVHYNSSEPAALQALAYTQGTDIHVGPGQEQHLPHEAWHVVQQKQGRVKPTMQMEGTAINNDRGLENEADVQGKKAANGISEKSNSRRSTARLADNRVQAALIQRTPDDAWNKISSMEDVNEFRPQHARSMLKDDFFSDWFVTKSYLLEDEWSDKPENEKAKNRPVLEKIMGVFLNLRDSETVDKDYSLLTHIRDEELKANEFGGSAAERLSWSGVGSKTLTSDVDVNLKGTGSIAAVTLFNQLFKTWLGWPSESGTVYDVNVYAQDFMEEVAFDTEDDLEKKTATLTPRQEVELEGNAFARFAADQDIWSLVKMRTYMTDGEWQAYRESIVGVTAEGMDEEALQNQQELDNRFVEAEYNYHESKSLLEKKMEEIDKSADEIYAPMKANLAQAKQYLSDHQIEMMEEAPKMMAANLIYQEKLDDVAAIRLELRGLNLDPETRPSELEAAGLRLKNALSYAIIFANEAYLTQGAVHFVVIGQQIGGNIRTEMQKKLDVLGGKGGYAEVNIKLSDEEHLQSMREQVGDTLKVLNNYAKRPLWQAAYNAGKYIDRMVKSAVPLIGTLPVTSFDELVKVGKVALTLKGEKANSADQEERLDPIVSDLASNMSGFRAQIIKFGVEVEKSYRGKKAAQQQDIGKEDQPPEAKETNPVGGEMEKEIEQAKSYYDIFVDLLRSVFGS